MSEGTRSCPIIRGIVELHSKAPPQLNREVVDAPWTTVPRCDVTITSIPTLDLHAKYLKDNWGVNSLASNLLHTLVTTHRTRRRYSGLSFLGSFRVPLMHCGAWSTGYVAMPPGFSAHNAIRNYALSAYYPYRSRTGQSFFYTLLLPPKIYLKL